ncbi:MAG: acetyl-CoA carboxylase biotin carboxylase subunit [Candidatus Marinimicrobia bacterium]|nr:acetyl-CoA carboxylase biotin carboxylase subunit [Candidatus Neomarinimicrobiota bacterium]MCK9484482.1 acetyl-CoA carboxylase biotin carboxylase subunit [Candidatus Neomarinimicrobiota bacterium]MCK9559916.1 acetyl-CoA carboxylase biotin carboxylase subunit [Candidatus Neomarinimicrobiota bacterium]MDD5540371.1 acetyl-CoA carboxylase biotin carboxylase subunit [Candidatus Neomarinimicrobiota bacterium]
MIKKLLIANRGEIALRVIRACKELNIPTVAVYSVADALSLHVRFADEAVCIGPADSKNSYLKMAQIISAAEVTNADAIHPGYGFLAENADFAQMCEDNEIIFVGPKPIAIRTMGDKAQARETVKKAGVPIIPGSETVVKNSEEIKRFAEIHGYPIILKASAGGGGRGMRIVRQIAELENAYSNAREEAQKAFGNSDLYVEKLIEDARHIEVQIIGDNYGNIIHLGERECSIQRRHQKLIEESPSPVVDAELREKLGKIAIRAAKAVKYTSAGTIEFLMDKKRNFYFMEMNTRIQVEHPVTEMVTGIDLVKEQIRLARGEKIPKWMKKFNLRGHAIECRINAENPAKNFLPSPGKIQVFHAPGGPGTRMDTHVYAGYEIPSHYDSLLGKLITHGKDRMEAIIRMERALDETIVEGVPTTIPFHKAILKNEAFRTGDFNIAFLNNFKF